MIQQFNTKKKNGVYPLQVEGRKKGKRERKRDSWRERGKERGQEIGGHRSIGD